MRKFNLKKKIVITFCLLCLTNYLNCKTLQFQNEDSSIYYISDHNYKVIIKQHFKYPVFNKNTILDTNILFKSSNNDSFYCNIFICKNVNYNTIKGKSKIINSNEKSTFDYIKLDSNIVYFDSIFKSKMLVNKYRLSPKVKDFVLTCNNFEFETTGLYKIEEYDIPLDSIHKISLIFVQSIKKIINDEFNPMFVDFTHVFWVIRKLK